MVKIALDPAMYHADLSVADEVRKAAELGYSYLELSPRPDFFFWHRYPKADNAEIARYDLTEDSSTETAMVFGELYRNGAEWKFRAIGQGYASGLRGIAQDFGVNV